MTNVVVKDWRTLTCIELKIVHGKSKEKLGALGENRISSGCIKDTAGVIRYPS